MPHRTALSAAQRLLSDLRPRTSDLHRGAMTRRSFLRQTGALLAASAAVAACSPVAPPATPASLPAPVPTATTAPSAQALSARVAFVKTNDRADGVRRALQLLGDIPVQGTRVLIKPNFNSADPAPGSTHPDILRSVVEHLWQREAQHITLADRSGMGNTRQVFNSMGVFDLARDLNLEALVLDELGADGWDLVQLPDSHWRDGFPLARCCRTADLVVQTCCLKTHRFGGHFTMSLKNSVGLVAKLLPGSSTNYMSELHSSPHQRRLIAEINAAYQPGLIVLDGVDAFVKGGPASGEQAPANVILAGVDRIAIDAVGVALLRYWGTTPEVSQGPVFAQEQIARAVELGLGVTTPDAIEFVTDDAESAAYAAEIRTLLHADGAS